MRAVPFMAAVATATLLSVSVVPETQAREGDTDVGVDENTFIPHTNVAGRDDTSGTQPVGGNSDSPYVSYESYMFCANGSDIDRIEICRGPQRCGNDGYTYTSYGIRRDGTRENLGTYCDEPGDIAPAQPRLTLAMVANAFRRVPLPDSVIDIQPPGGRTLVNLPTIMSTEATTFTETVRLLGQTVTLQITPTTYHWVHGDGTEGTTHNPGVRYTEHRPMSDYLTHTYLRTAEHLPARVDTTWSATFSVNGGPAQPVPDTVTIQGDPAPLDVVEADPVLVGYDR